MNKIKLGRDYIIEDGLNFTCMYIEGGYAWMRNNFQEAATAYVWDLTGKALSLTETYNINWAKTNAWHRLQDATAAWEEVNQNEEII